MFRIFISHAFPGPGIPLLKRQRDFQVVVREASGIIPRRELLEHAQGASALLVMLTEHVDSELLTAAGPSLKIVANMAVGYDNLDLKELKTRAISATNTPDIPTTAVAEHTVSLIFALAKRLIESDCFTRAQKYRGWEPDLLLGTELQSKTLGIVGLGRIGSGVAERCQSMGMKIIYYDRARTPAFETKTGARFATLEMLLKSSDFVSIHVPLLPTTHHLIDGKALRLMKKSAYLVNTARGPIVDEVALTNALIRGKIRGAALDVYEHEPKISAELRRLPNVILTPHTASATIETRSAMGELAAKNILAALRGKSLLTPVLLA